MLPSIRGLFVVVSLAFCSWGLFACEASAAESSAAPTVSSPVLLAQYAGGSRSGNSANNIRLPYGVIRLIVLGVMGAGGWLGSKLYR